jgi:hypothetical protein
VPKVRDGRGDKLHIFKATASFGWRERLMVEGALTFIRFYSRMTQSHTLFDRPSLQEDPDDAIVIEDSSDDDHRICT